MATRMQQRRSPASDWSTANPILAAGEIGYEIDTNKFKIGDGINHWADLTYFDNADNIGGSLGDYIPLSQRGADNGVATLDSDGKLTASQIPNIDEISQDAINAALIAGTGIDKTYDDASNTITIDIDSTIATKTYADNAAATAAAAIVDSAPSTLDTLNELAAALGDDANYATTISTTLGLKAPLASPALTGTPTAPTATAGTNTTQVSTTAFVKTAIDALKTADIEEQTNLYFTDQRAVDAIVYAINHGLDITLDGGTL
jgi:hypothetical protein